MTRHKLQPRRGSHLPVLMKATELTTGPILELGCGIYSTIFLHWACYASKRRLVTYENNPGFFEFAQMFAADYHQIHCIDDWDAVDLSEQWSVALVDHAPEGRRIKEVAKLTHVEYVVCHDTENSSDKKYRYSKIFRLFRYRWKYDAAFPHTTVFSNIHDVTNWV